MDGYRLFAILRTLNTERAVMTHFWVYSPDPRLGADFGRNLALIGRRICYWEGDFGEL